ncbi:MAG: hypothetical protein WC894_04040 [Patescibacteria group bacterium]
MLEKTGTVVSASDALDLHNLTIISDVKVSDENAAKSRLATASAVKSAQDLIKLGGRTNVKAAERIVTKAAEASNLPRKVIVHRVTGK